MSALAFPELQSVFRGLIVRDLQAVAGREGLCVGEDMRVHREGKTFVVCFNKTLKHPKRRRLLERLENANIEHKVGDDY